MAHGGIGDKTSAGLAATFAGLCVACVGGAQMVLKSPVSNQCESAGLQGCEQITEGVLLYADGNQAEGKKKLALGLSENIDNAAELKAFAVSLDTVGQFPGAGQYVEPLRPVIDLVREAAAQAEQRQQVAKASTSPKAEAVVSDAKPTGSALGQVATLSEETTVQDPWRKPATSESIFIMVAGNTRARACRHPKLANMLCLYRLVPSKRVVSDIIVSPACPSDVVVFAEVSETEPAWLVFVPREHGVSIHGASLPVDDGEILTFGIDRAATEAESEPDIRCGVTLVWH